MRILLERSSRSRTCRMSKLLCLSLPLALHMAWTRLLPSLYIFPRRGRLYTDSCFRMGSSILMLGAGPTGLVLAQLLRQNGGCHVVVAAPEGLKMDLAKSVSLERTRTMIELILGHQLGAGDVYVPLSRKDSSMYRFHTAKSLEAEVMTRPTIQAIEGGEPVRLRYRHRGYRQCVCPRGLHQLCAKRWQARGVWCLFQRCSCLMATIQDLRG